MFSIKTTRILTAMLFVFSPIVNSDEIGEKIVTQGNTKGATACFSCHGANGEGSGMAGFPRLSNLDQAYIVKQLQDFTNGKRNNPIMEPIAKALTQQESIAAANYIVQLNPKPTVAPKVENSILIQGEQLAKIGNWSKNIPACFACHGRGGYGVAAFFPALAGQHASYISQQIQAWKSGSRKNDSNDLMKGIALRLSDNEIKAVSAYLASLSAVKN